MELRVYFSQINYASLFPYEYKSLFDSYLLRARLTAAWHDWIYQTTISTVTFDSARKDQNLFVYHKEAIRVAKAKLLLKARTFVVRIIKQTCRCLSQFPTQILARG